MLKISKTKSAVFDKEPGAYKGGGNWLKISKTKSRLIFHMLLYIHWLKINKTKSFNNPVISSSFLR